KLEERGTGGHTQRFASAPAVPRFGPRPLGSAAAHGPPRSSFTQIDTAAILLIGPRPASRVLVLYSYFTAQESCARVRHYADLLERLEERRDVDDAGGAGHLAGAVLHL